jgi:hypothetical protein
MLPSNLRHNDFGFPPTTDAFTPYDEAHFAIYLSLLHASAEGTSKEEMSRQILGIDPEAEPDRAQATLEALLGRAIWLSEAGYRHLLED